MPFAEVTRDVPRRTEQGRYGQVALGVGRVVVRHAVDVAVLAGDQRGARGSAERIHHEGVAKAEAFAGEAIKVRGLQPREATLLTLFLLHDAQGVPALVVGEDVDEVGFTVGGVQGGESGEQEKKGAGHAYLTAGRGRSCDKPPPFVTSGSGYRVRSNRPGRRSGRRRSWAWQIRTSRRRRASWRWARGSIRGGKPCRPSRWPSCLVR